MDDAIGIVTSCVEESAKGIFHRARGGSINVTLDRREMDDVLAMKKGGNLDSLRIDFV